MIRPQLITHGSLLSMLTSDGLCINRYPQSKEAADVRAPQTNGCEAKPAEGRRTATAAGSPLGPKISPTTGINSLLWSRPHIHSEISWVDVL